MAERILVWGAGAIGGTIGAYLARAGRDVTFVDIVPDHVERIRAGRLAISGPVATLEAGGPAFLPGEVRGTWPTIFLAVKSQHTADATRSLLPHLAPDGCVVSLQNGLCEHEIAAIAGPDRTIGAFVNFGADWLGPGEILYGNRGAVVLGELDGRRSERLETLVATLRAFEPDAIATESIFSYLWGKLGYASMLFAQALGQAGIADTLARPELLPLWRRLGGETMRVAAAERVEPQGFNGFDPAAFAPGASDADARRSVAAMVAFNRPSAKTHSGVWRDLAIRKRPTEVDFQIAPVVRIGAGHGLACPTLQRLVDMIHEVERGTRPMTDGNLDELMTS